YGFWPAASEGDDIVVYTGRGLGSRTDNDLSPTMAGELARFNLLRQQEATPDGKANLSLADFISPHGDSLGAFAVTAGLGADALAKRFEREHDDYSSILVKALADRLAEAFATHLHERTRLEWGIDRPRASEDLHAENHPGIRPAFGYPACPDHS